MAVGITALLAWYTLRGTDDSYNWTGLFALVASFSYAVMYLVPLYLIYLVCNRFGESRWHGLVFELKKEANAAIWEFATGILVEKEFGRWSGTANFLSPREWGPDIPDEVESRLGLQARYRYSRLLEPAIEFYSGQDTRGLGPVFLGQINLGIKRQIKWEAGIIYGLDDRSPNETVRLLLELEF